MKTKTLYECKFCHTQFNDADKCKRYKGSHSKTKKIIATHYKTENNMIPALRDMDALNYIDVLLDNGKTVKYSATREVESR